MLEGPRVGPPAGEGAADQEVDRDGFAYGEVEPTEEDRLVGGRRLALDIATPVQGDSEFDGGVAPSLRLAWP